MNKEYKEILDKVVEDVLKEHCYSCDQWGTDFDDNNTINDWVSYITHYASNAIDFRNNMTEQRRYLTKAANLCISALITSYRNDKFADRHYD
jgi:hypothetical protein